MHRIKTIIFSIAFLFVGTTTIQAQVEAIFYILDGLRGVGGTSARIPSNISPKINQLQITDIKSLKDMPSIDPQEYLWYNGLTVYNPTVTSKVNADIPKGHYTWNGKVWRKTYTTAPSGSFKEDLQVLHDLQKFHINDNIHEDDKWVIDLENPENPKNLSLNGVFFEKINGEYRVVELRLERFFYTDITIKKGLEALVYFSVSENHYLKNVDLKLPNLIYFENTSSKSLQKVTLESPKLVLARLKGNKALKALDVTRCPNLVYLSLSENPLNFFDVSKNTELRHLFCPANTLSTLDLSQNTKLAFLNCRSNALNALDMSSNKELAHLYCNNNKLSVLDVSKNRKLKRLAVTWNLLRSLDVKNNLNLTDLWCGGNALKSLDLSQNISLELLDCSANNSLTTLNVDNCAAMKSLKCSHNKLTTLDLSRLSKLQELNCNFNNLSEGSVRICNIAFKSLVESSKVDNQKFFPGEKSTWYAVVPCR